MASSWISWLLIGSLAACAAFVRGMMLDQFMRVDSRAVLTSAELRFFRMLKIACGNRYEIYGQVGMSALIEPVPGLSKRQFWRNFNRFGQKRLDFILVDGLTGRAVMVIELDDPSHNDRKKDDLARDALLASAGYVVLRFPTRPWPSVSDLRTAILRRNVQYRLNSSENITEVV